MVVGDEGSFVGGSDDDLAGLDEGFVVAEHCLGGFAFPDFRVR